MLELVIASGKGGVGKSTVSSSILHYMHGEGREVFAVDADVEAPNLHLIFGIKEWKVEKPYSEGWVAKIDRARCDECGICRAECPFRAISVKDGRHVINEVICEGCLTCSLVCPRRAIYRVRVDEGVVRAGNTGYGFGIAGAKLRVGRPNSGKLVTEVKNLAKEIGGSKPTYIVDAPAGIGCSVVSALAGSNGVVLVVEPTPASLADVKRLHRLAKHFMLPSALVINKADINPEFADEILRWAKEENIYYLGSVPYDDVVPKSMVAMKPLLEYAPNSKAAIALREISKKFMEVLVDGWREWFRTYKPKKPEPYIPLIIKPSQNIK
ncbi:MAG: ATP-binding protein [Desulfurococcales archaeon]|nr:ATP-binding protein [Desulfurococcales archaeon]